MATPGLTAAQRRYLDTGDLEALERELDEAVRLAEEVPPTFGARVLGHLRLGECTRAELLHDLPDAVLSDAERWDVVEQLAGQGRVVITANRREPVLGKHVRLSEHELAS